MMRPSGHLNDIVLEEENGLSCAICREGFRNAPTEPLGVYVQVSHAPLEEHLVCGSSDTVVLPVEVPSGYMSVTHFVIIHFSCHLNVSLVHIV